MKHINLFTVLLIFLFSACENTENDYKQYIEGGPIRYIGKVKNLTIEQGWQRFRLRWENSIDPSIEKVEIQWKTTDEIIGKVVLDKTATEFVTEQNFENKSYTFNIYSVDETGNKSFKETVTGRPFSSDHEELRIYTKLENKYFFVGNQLILVLDSESNNVINPTLSFYRNGQQVEKVLTANDFNSRFVVIENVDTDRDVQITRSVNIENCFDVINFPAYTLDRTKKSFNTDFLKYLKKYYNVSTIDNEFINNTQTLYFDENLSSIEDILYFPNLTRVVLGGNRYFHPSYIANYLASIQDTEGSLFALRKMREQRSLEVDIYNNNYNLADALDFENTFGNPTLPTLNYLDRTNWTTNCSTDENGYNSRTILLLDDNINTSWRPMVSYTGERTHHITIDMQSSQTVNGFVFRQAVGYYDLFIQDEIHITVSNDGETWKETFIHPDRTVGHGKGETTLLRLSESTTARYVRVEIKDVITRYGRYVDFADFLVF